MIRTLFAIVGALVVFAQTTAAQDQTPQRYQPIKDEEIIEHFAYQRYSTVDRFGRDIIFYVSKPFGSLTNNSLPLVICIQGSGSQSIFQEVATPNGKRIASGGTETVVQRKFKDRVRILVVEKPGVEFLVQPSRPGSSEKASEEFNREFTLERWVEAINAATIATTKLPGVNSSRVLALGHSEGGQVACELAAVNKSVTHVATMAGGGPTQLYDFLVMARSGDLYDPNATPEERVAELKADWQKVLDEPQAAQKFVLGHSHLRWSTFLNSSPIQAILKSKAKVFIGQGTKDTNSLPASAEVLFAELLARGRDVTYERVDGGDHAFMKPGDNGKGWFDTNAKAVAWFLE